MTPSAAHEQPVYGNFSNEELPEGWVRVKLPEVSTINMGQSPPGSSYNDGGKGIPFFQGKADFGQRHPKVRIWCTQPKKVAKPGDVLLSIRAPVGPTNVADRECIIGRGLAALTPLGGIPTEVFLYALRLLEPQLSLSGTGSTFTAINKSDIAKIEMALPPIAEQKRIVAKVEQLIARVNAARERLAKVPAILKRFRQSVLAVACSGRLTADWRENDTGVTSSELSIREILRFRQKQWVLEQGSAKKYKQPKSVRNERLPEVPESWKYVSSDTLFSFVTSGSRGWAKYYAHSGSIFIRIGNLDHDTIALDLSQIQCVNPPIGAERQRTRVQPGDILVSITADVGMIALVPDGIGKAYVNQHVAIARPVAGVYQPWLACYLASAKGGQAQFQNLQRGATKIGLGLDDIRSVTVPFPPVKEQKEIAKRIEIFFKMADAIEKRVTAATVQAEKLTQAILAKAFRGELVSTEAELARLEGRPYEPASALLSKIEAQRKNVKPQRKREKSRWRKRNE